jgi:glycosyltransferase involved in cell wall biosynthesis
MDPAAPKVHVLLMHAWGMGGTIRATLNLAAALSSDHEVEVLSVVRRRDTPFFAFPAGVKVTAIDDQRPRRLHGPARLVRRGLRAVPSRLVHRADRASRICTAWTDAWLWRRLHAIAPGDIVIGTRPALNLLLPSVTRAGVICIGQEHMHLSAHPPLLREAIRRGYGRLDAVTTLTHRDRDQYRDLLGPRTPAVCLPNAVAAATEPRAALNAPVLLAAGRLTHQKGFDRLLRAFVPVAAQHPEWTLRICGSGPKRRQLQRLVEELGIAGQVVLRGRVANMARERANASAFVLSSRFEGLPMVLLEAMAAGVPAVAFDCPTGPREVIRHGVNGLLVPDGDEDALAAALLTVIEDVPLRRALGAAAHQSVAAYGPDAVAEGFARLLSRLGAAPQPEARRSTRAIARVLLRAATRLLGQYR